MMEEESKTLDIEGKFKVSGDYFNEDDEVTGELDLDSMKVNGFTVDEMSKCFKKWMLYNQERFLKDFNNPNCKIEIDGKEFTMRFTDEYTFKMVLEEVEKQKEGEPEK